MKIRTVFRILAGVTLAVFILLVYSKIQEWVGSTVGDSNWALIIVGLLLLIFALAGYVTTKHIKKKFS